MTSAAGGAPAVAVVPESYAKDAMLSWYRGEFAAANAIIDALCGHLAAIDGGGRYEHLFTAIHRRRMNWIPVLHMQKFYSIADVNGELRRVSECRLVSLGDGAHTELADAKVVKEATPAEDDDLAVEPTIKENSEEVLLDCNRAVEEVAVAENGDFQAVEEAKVVVDVDCPAVEVDGGCTAEEVEEETGDLLDHKLEDASDVTRESLEQQHSSLECAQICSNHEDCLERPERIKILKGFVAKEAVKGHMVNIVKGLKVYEDIFTDTELGKLSEYISELRQSGHNGELAGDTFILFNKQMKGNKKEIIQLGVPLFQPTNEESTSTIEQIPPVLESIIDHLVQWRLLPETRRPNSCILNFFDEDEHSQPYFKPPHLDNPISTLVLNETKMAFGRAIACDASGNYKGSLTLEIKQGSLLVMRGNSADMARHVICPSSNRRVAITFLKVRPASQVESPKTPLPSKAMTLWQPGTPQVQKVPAPGFIAYAPQPMVQTAWGLAFRAPVVMLPPPRTMVMSPPPTKQVTTPNGTGVFLPWTASPKKHTKHLPPRMQKRRQLATLPALEAKA